MFSGGQMAQRLTPGRCSKGGGGNAEMEKKEEVSWLGIWLEGINCEGYFITIRLNITQTIHHRSMTCLHLLTHRTTNHTLLRNQINYKRDLLSSLWRESLVLFWKPGEYKKNGWWSRNKIGTYKASHGRTSSELTMLDEDGWMEEGTSPNVKKKRWREKKERYDIKALRWMLLLYVCIRTLGKM